MKAELHKSILKATPSLERYSILLCKDSDDAKDLFQDTIVKIIERYPSYDSTKSSFLTWSGKVMHSRYLDSLNKNKGQAQYNYLDHLRITTDGIETINFNDGALMLDVMGTIMEKMLPIYSQVITLRYVDDMKYNDISELLNIPLNTVKSRIHSATKEIRDKMKAIFGEEINFKKSNKYPEAAKQRAIKLGKTNA
jgi:RNA polymerase sigma-70 factor, ECF subfamily